MHLCCCDTSTRAVCVKNEFQQSRWHRDYSDKLLHKSLRTRKKMFYCCLFDYLCIFSYSPPVCGLRMDKKIAAKRRKISVQKGFATDRSLIRILSSFFLPGDVRRNWFRTQVCVKSSRLIRTRHERMTSFFSLLPALLRCHTK